MVKTEAVPRAESLRLAAGCSDVVVNVVASMMRPLKIGSELALLRNPFIASTKTELPNSVCRVLLKGYVTVNVVDTFRLLGATAR